MQLSLFDNCEPDTEIRPIDLTDEEGIKKATYILSKTTANELHSFAASLCQTLNHYSYVATDAQGQQKEPEAIERMRKPSPKKNDYVAFLAIFFTAKNFHYVLAHMNDNMRKLWLEVAQNYYISPYDATKIMGKECIVDTSWSFNVIEDLQGFFSTDSDSNSPWRETKHNIHIAFAFYYLYEITHLTLLQNYPTVTQLPDGLKTFNAEKDVFTDYAIFESLQMANKLKVGKNKLRTISFDKAISDINIREFFNDDSWPQCKDASKLRAISMGLSYGDFFNYYGADELPQSSIQDKIGYVFDNLFELESCFFQLFLPHIEIDKKRIKSYLSDITCRNFMLIMKATTEKLSDTEWTAIERFCYTMRCDNDLNKNLECEKVFKLFDIRYFDKNCLYNQYTQEFVKPENIIDQISSVAVKSFLFILASWGIVEIAYHELPQKGDTAIYDALQYVRLTKLGRYILELDKEYTPPVDVDSTPDFELDPDHLLIKLLRPESPRIVVLDKYAQSVTPSLYSVSTKTFLKDCNTKEELESKIEHFKMLMQSEPSPVWQAFFDKLLQQADPLRTAGKSYLIRRINANDKALQQIILTDASLKQYILRAENYLLLIEQKHMDDVKKILRNYGYLLS